MLLNRQEIRMIVWALELVQHDPYTPYWYYDELKDLANKVKHLEVEDEATANLL